jgi:hypothetical protein
MVRPLKIPDVTKIYLERLNALAIVDYNDNTSFLASRRKFVSQGGLGLAATLVLAPLDLRNKL